LYTASTFPKSLKKFEGFFIFNRLKTFDSRALLCKIQFITVVDEIDLVVLYKKQTTYFVLINVPFSKNLALCFFETDCHLAI
jgi:hypothetical protein